MRAADKPSTTKVKYNFLLCHFPLANSNSIILKNLLAVARKINNSSLFLSILRCKVKPVTKSW